MTDWTQISSLAAAGSTLVLAVATFASVQSANRSARTADRAARTAERSLLAGQRPLLMNSRLQDRAQKIDFQEGTTIPLGGGRAALKTTDNVVYMAVSIRNVGTGLAVLHGWYLCPEFQRERWHPPLEDFTTQNRDIYVAPGDTSFWQGAYRDPGTAAFKAAAAAIDAGDPMMLSLLYGDYEGGQRVISQFTLRKAPQRRGDVDGALGTLDPGRLGAAGDHAPDVRHGVEDDDSWLAGVVRHFNIDRPDPR